MSVHSLAIVQSRVVISALSRRDDCLSPIPAYRGLSMQCLEISGSQFAEAANDAPTARHSSRHSPKHQGEVRSSNPPWSRTRRGGFRPPEAHRHINALARGSPPLSELQDIVGETDEAALGGDLLDAAQQELASRSRCRAAAAASDRRSSPRGARGRRPRLP